MNDHGDISRPAREGALHAWLQLLRAPNLLTVPGDPLCGFLVAASAPLVISQGLWRAIVASLLLYGGGLLLNDLFDIETDRRERPDRPLPSRRVSPKAVWIVASLAMGAGLALCLPFRRASIVASVLIAAIFAYNAGLKRFAVLGPAIMGACRGLSVLLGVAFLPGHHAALTAGLLTAVSVGLYVAGITVLASRETENSVSPVAAWSPTFAAAPALAFAASVTEPTSSISVVGLLLAVVVFFFAARQSFMIHSGNAGEVPSIVGSLIGNLILLQAAFVFLSGRGTPGALCGVALLALWPLHRILRNLFYAS